jgi:transcriptional regulator with XRE-family HTH domain
VKHFAGPPKKSAVSRTLVTAAGRGCFTETVSQTTEPTVPKSQPTMDELWRRALGRQLRELRLSRGERLDDTAARAGISPQYLSEIERGRKEPSSEMIAAVIGALECTLAEVLVRVAGDLGSATADVIDIRSSVSIGRPVITSTPGVNAPFEASLSLAA